jgi:EAL domain-containing protein (putative c-di-GMP-specific phosphodiesterase class I)/GGDEF domain-containing protein
MKPRGALPFARLDPITYLPNRHQFTEDYGASQPRGRVLVMITLADAAHFNEVLRALGHEYSEDFIRAGAARLRAIVPAEVTIYHVSILSLTFMCFEHPELLVSRILERFTQPLVCGGIPIGTRVGIGLCDCESRGATDVLRSALVAAQDGRNNETGWARYDTGSDNAQQRGFLLLSDLAAALRANDQLNLRFQPKFDMASGRPTGAEALVRWTHPTLGAISPGEFIPLAEATAHIHTLTNWVLERAVAQAAAWAAGGLALTMAVNVSPHNLARRGFARYVAEVLRRHQVEPAAVELEFTEGALASNNLVVLGELRALRAQGIHVALDDFGTGFSNLSYITRLPADIIKIDQSFIRQIRDDERSALLVRTLIELAHRLDYRVVAEGIEDAETYEMLSGWGCDEGQGYFMSKPVEAGVLAALLGGAPAPA